jgi:iron(III) transport system substrate-binding protein
MFSTQKRIILLLAIICLLTACGTSDSAARREILIYTPHGKDLLQDFAARYEAANPGVKVNFVDMGSREVLERIRAERNRPQADLWWGASQMTFQDAADEGLLAAYRPTWADKVPADSHDKNDFWYGTYETPEVIAFNSEVLNEQTAPQDWDEVLDKKWRDKILIRNPIPSDSMRVIFGAMIQRAGSPENGFEWLRKLDRNVKEYTADGTLLMQKMARQEGLISLWNMPDVLIFREQRKLPIGYVFPKSGTPVVIDGIAIVKGAPHEEEARKFYEFVTTQESLLHAAQSYYRLPVARTDLDKSKLPAWMQADIQRMNVDWNALRKNGNDWMRYWDNEIRGRNKN